MKLFNLAKRLFVAQTPPESSASPQDDNDALQPVEETGQQLEILCPQPEDPQTTTRRPPRRYNHSLVGIVGFHQYGFIIAKPAAPSAPWLLERSQWLHRQLGDGSNLTDGLRQALHLLAATPRAVQRKIWLLSDGEPNMELQSMASVIEACQQSRISINTVGVGYYFNETLLRDIASATHRGRFLSVQGLWELIGASTYSHAIAGYRSHQRGETTILVIDCSGSMFEPLQGQTKIHVVQETIWHLLHHQQPFLLCS